LLRPRLLGKFSVRIWTNGFQDRLEGLFKRFALGRGSHLALQPDRPGELGERTLVPVLVADRGVDKFMRQNASDLIGSSKTGEIIISQCPSALFASAQH